MARCEDMKLLLGPFEDGELEAHEMQEVARHVVGCTDCDGELADYRMLAVSLRGVSLTPNLAGFSAAVIARIEELPVPFGRRLRRYVTSFADGIGATFATGFAAAAVAVVTAVILTPYFRQGQIFNDLLRRPTEIARATLSAPAPAVALGDVARNTIAPAVSPNVANAPSGAVAGGDISPVIDSSGNSGAIIDRLEAESPSVAVWSEPQSDTTVIWVPDQRH